MKNSLSIKRGLLTACIVLISLATTLAVEVTVNFTTSTGDPIEGSVVEYNKYSYGGWTYFGITDVNGQVIGEMEQVLNHSQIRVYLNGQRKTFESQDINVNPIFNFATIAVTVILKDSEGDFLESSNAQFNAGGWKVFGTGVSNETIEMLPGILQFRVYYNNSNGFITQDLLINPIVEFQTSNISLHFTGNIVYLTNVWHSFQGSNMELFAGEYRFRFSGDNYANIVKYISIPIDGIEKTVEYVKFKSSSNNGIESAPTQYNNFGWEAGTVTNSNGICLNFIEGLATVVSTRLYHGGTYQDIEQDLSDDSFIDFNTVSVSMDLLSSDSIALESTNAEYYASGWQQFGDGVTSESIELLAQDYNFRVSYAGGSESKHQDVSLDSEVVFETISVEANLFDSNADALDWTNLNYSQNGGAWMQFDNIDQSTASRELLNGEYEFRLFYADATIDKDQNVGDDAIVNFATIPVTMNVYDENGNVLNGSNAMYDFSGATMFGDGTTPGVMELLPVTYAFSAMYDGDALATSQNTAFNPNVAFVIASEEVPELISIIDEEDVLLEELEMIALDGINETLTNDVQTNSKALAFPNPFSESITLSYEVKEDANVNISIYNMNGTLISTIVDVEMHSGSYEVKWNADDMSGSKVPNGTYIYKITIDNEVESNIMMLQK